MENSTSPIPVEEQQKCISKHGSIDLANHNFISPIRGVRLPNDIPRWEKSQAYSDLVGFILLLNESVKNKKVSDDYTISETVKKVVSVLDTIESWIASIPPIDQPQRFGNKAFRSWFARLKEEVPGLLTAVLPPSLSPAVQELAVYLVESFGNDTRIDYGTGHELAFVAFMYCLCAVGAVVEADFSALVLQMFDRYLRLCRCLQQTYCMEPAGSHGVWSLDDFQFLPFLWGSSQLRDHKRLKPKSFPEPDIYNTFHKDYLFLSAIKYINQVKNGPFAEHSNQLWGISGVAGWPKVNQGLIKMYRVEVLSKFPIVQHFLFGSLLTMEPSPNPPPPVTPATQPPSPHEIMPHGVMGSMPQRGAMLSDITGVMPPRGAMPPGITGVMPPRGAMPPGITGVMPPRGAMPPGITGVMPLRGAMPPGITGVMPPMGVMPPRGSMPPPVPISTASNDNMPSPAPHLNKKESKEKNDTSSS